MLNTSTVIWLTVQPEVRYLRDITHYIAHVHVNIKPSEINSKQDQSFPGWTRLLFGRTWCVWFAQQSSTTALWLEHLTMTVYNFENIF
jgi:hypothetical protein